MAHITPLRTDKIDSKLHVKFTINTDYERVLIKKEFCVLTRLVSSTRAITNKGKGKAGPYSEEHRRVAYLPFTGG